MNERTFSRLKEVVGVSADEAASLRRMARLRAGLPLLRLYAQGRIDAPLLLELMSAESGVEPEPEDIGIEPDPDILRRAQWEVLSPAGAFPTHADPVFGLVVVCVDPSFLSGLFGRESESRIHPRLVAPAQLGRLYRRATRVRWKIEGSALLNEDFEAAMALARDELQRLYQRMLRTSGIQDRVVSDVSGSLGGARSSSLIRALDPLLMSGSHSALDEASSWSRSAFSATATAEELRPHELHFGSLDSCTALLRKGEREMEVSLRLACACARSASSRDALVDEVIETLGLAWRGAAFLWVRGSSLRVGAVVAGGVRRLLPEKREIRIRNASWWRSLLEEHEALVAMLSSGDPIRQVFGVAGRSECLAIVIRLGGRVVALLVLDGGGGRVHCPEEGMSELRDAVAHGLRHVILRQRAASTAHEL